jgi:hypothetical protein
LDEAEVILNARQRLSRCAIAVLVKRRRSEKSTRSFGEFDESIEEEVQPSPE